MIPKVIEGNKVLPLTSFPDPFIVEKVSAEGKGRGRRRGIEVDGTAERVNVFELMRFRELILLKSWDRFIARIYVLIEYGAQGKRRTRS